MCLGFKAEWTQWVYHDPLSWMLTMQKSDLTSEFSLDQSLGVRAIKSCSLKCLLHGICSRRRQLGQRLRKWGENNSVTFYFVCRTHFTFLKYLLSNAHFALPSCMVGRTQISFSPSLISLGSSEVMWNKIALRALITEFWSVTLRGPYGFQLLLWENVLDSIVTLRQHSRFEHWKLSSKRCWFSLWCHHSFIKKNIE